MDQTKPTVELNVGPPPARFRAVSLIPNLLSLARVVLGLSFPFVPASWRLSFVVAAAVTDLLDGTISRAFRATSVTGQILDPVADKLFVFSVLATMLMQNELAAWQAALVGFRDLAVLAGVAGVVMKHEWSAVREMPPSWLGKVTTAAQFGFFVSLLYLERVQGFLLAATAVLSVLAGVDYLRRFRRGKVPTLVLVCLLGAVSGVSLAGASGFGRCANDVEFGVIDFGDEPAETKALAFLTREVPAWPKENRCYSCHNNGDGARALFAARSRGRSISAAALDDTTQWLVRPDDWDQKDDESPFKDKRLARIQFAAALAAGIESGAINDRSVLVRAAELVVERQDADGSWHVDPAGTVGSPATYGRPLATAIAARVLRDAGTERFREPLGKARRWLAELPTRNVLEAAAQLIAESTGDDTIESRECRVRCVELLVKAQSRDGGWGPFVRSPPEIFDTALVLVALAPLTERTEVPKMLARGRAFLIASQSADGSWPETTRPPGATSYAQRLSTTAWATMALLATTDLPKD